MRVRPVIFPLLAMVAISDTSAWGDLGHRITCEIAWQDLRETPRKEVLEILSHDRSRYRSFPEACLWADGEGRSHPHEATRHLHYINLSRGAPGVSIREHCAGKREGCVVTAIVKYTGVLMQEDASGDARLEALKFLSHFVGDVHQPLHAGYGDDLGGNRVKVSFLGVSTHGSDRKLLNLHSIWDVQMIGHSGINLANWRDRARELHSTITRAEREQWAMLDPVEWANESYEIVRRYVYRGNHLGREYYEENYPRLEARIRQGGVRLALLLNRIFSEDSHRPPFYVSRRADDLYHYPDGKMAQEIEAKELEIHVSPPEGKKLHEGCPL